jgi:hypothetical protein
MSSVEKSPRKFGNEYRRPRRGVSPSSIIMGAVTVIVFATTGYIFEYGSITSYAGPEQSALARQLPAARTANANPAPIATPKS